VISTRWLNARKRHWDRLESLVESSRGGGLSSFSHRELQELGLLYRQAASDLSVVREDPTSRRLADYLNQLLGRAHNLVYMSRRARPRGIVRFYRETWPRAFRATLPLTLAATAIFVLMAAAGFLTCLSDPGFQRFILGDEMIETIERREMWTHSVLAMKPVASSAILTNNIAVSLMTVATGITAGLGTLYFLIFNGLLLGVVSAACWQAGMSLDFWSFVVPHGVLELPAIFIAGGAGLAIARGLLFPGLLPRRDALALGGRLAARLTFGILPMLFVAGGIEGFVSPRTLPHAAKLLFGAALFSLLLLYLARAGRAERPVTPGPDP